MTRSWNIGLAGAVVAVGLPLMVVAQKTETKGEPNRSEGRAETYTVDPIHSSNWFRIKHLNVANFYGRFNEIAGTYTLDDVNPVGSSFDIRIKADSIDTHNDARNQHLKSADFFDAEKNPEITFKSTSVKKTGDKEYEVKGDLTLHGVTKPLTVRIERTGAGTGMKGEYRSGLETSFEIKRSDFGMNTMQGPLGDEVRLMISIEGIRQ